MKSKRLIISLFCALLAALPAQANDLFLGPIPVQFTAGGSIFLLDLHRFYQPTPTSQFQIDGAEALQVSYDRTRLQLQVRVESSAHGLIDLPFRVTDGKTIRPGVLTLAVRGQNQHEFIYESPAQVATVAVAGSFNGWSKEANPMRADAKGVFRAKVSLAPGNYSYKLVVDGKWAIDQGNSAREPDGFGGENSRLQIGQNGAGSGPAIYAEKLDSEKLTVRSSGPVAIAKVSAVAEWPDGSSRVVEAMIRPEEISVPTAGLPANGRVRVVAVDRAGRPGNVVLCSLGKAEGFRWQDAIMYYALTDRFQNGDHENDRPIENAKVLPPANYHGGDWRRIEQKIKEGYFKNLGVNTIWIAPLNKNPDVACQEYPEPHRWYTGYHGYWPVSPTEVEPRFGDRAALKSLITTAHEHGLKVIADLVLHHVHAEHPWWKEHRSWFGELELPDGTKNLRRWDDYQFTTWFEPYMPTFNFDNAEAVAALIDNSAWWVKEYDLDGFRLDAVKHIPNDFWWKFRSALRERGAAAYLSAFRQALWEHE